MPFISFTKSADLKAPDDLRINSTAVLYVEASRPELMGRTMIHMLGQGALVSAVMEPIGTVITALSGEKFNLVECTRHYLARALFMYLPRMSATFDLTCPFRQFFGL